MKTTPLFVGDEYGLRDADVAFGRQRKDPSDFGMQLRIHRIAAGMSQGDLANKLGVSQATVSRLETGDIALSDELRLRINQWFQE